jgi:hypothetical protein
MHRLDILQLAEIAGFAPCGELNRGARIARRVFGLRMLAVKNSMKRRAASRSGANRAGSSREPGTTLDTALALSFPCCPIVNDNVLLFIIHYPHAKTSAE